MKQIEIKDEKGYLKYTVIPNYKMKENFLTSNELVIYKVLKKLAYELKLTLLAQVSLKEIIEINNRRNSQQLFNRIMAKTIDFVLYNEEKNIIECCIELDDETHKKEERKERDKFLDEMLEGIVKLVHIKREQYYDYEILKNKITTE